LRVGIFPGLTFAGCSSRSITVSPWRLAATTGAISQEKVPSSLASSARDSDASAKWSCASRVNWNRSAQASANTPMSLPLS